MKYFNWLRLPTASRKEIIASGLVGAVFGSFVTALVTPIITPLLTRLGEKLSLSMYPAVVVTSCAPLKSSRTVLSFDSPAGGLQIVADFPHHIRNETFIYVENRSGKELKNAYLSINPVPLGTQYPKLMTAEVMSTAIRRSEAYTNNYDAKHHAFTVSMPILGLSESVLVSQVFDVPVGFIVELTADEFTSRRFFNVGCPDWITVNDVLNHAGAWYVGDNCTATTTDTGPGSTCSYTDDSPLQITEEMAGKTIRSEDFVFEDPLKLRIPELVRRNSAIR